MTIVWMPHAGHLLVSNHCRFHLNTYVNSYIVSTVGEYVPDSAVRKIMREHRHRQTALIGDAEEADFGFEEIGYQRLYETMVFHAQPSGVACCPYVQVSRDALECQGYNGAGDAYQGHLRMVAKYAALDVHTVQPEAVSEKES